MSELQMTGREFAALVLRILGVVILLSGLVQTFFTLLGAGHEGWFPWGLFGSLLALVFIGAVALPLIFHSETLVAWVFPESDKTIAFAVSRRDLIMGGLALVGAWFLATNLPYVVRLASEVLWRAGGERRSQIQAEFFSRAAFDALGGLFACAAGWVLFRYAGRITDWWESRARRDS